MSDARETALFALGAVRRGAYSDLYLKSAIKKAELSTRDAGLCTAICALTLQNSMLYDFYIASYSSLRMNKIAPMVLDILRLAVSQIVSMDRVPPSAAINSAVELTKTHANPFAAGFVNAVLRKIAANKDKLPAVPQDDTRAYLSIQYSHPRWLVDLFCDRLGEEDAKALLRENNSAPPIFARLNTLRAGYDEAVRRIEADGVTVERLSVPGAVTLAGTGDIASLPSFNEGLFTVQDTASQLCAYALDAQPGMRMLDACAAPGGKSLAAAAHMENRGEIVACDIHQHKLGIIEAEAARLGASIIAPYLGDAARFVPAWEDHFDRALADVPCSGLGIIRKKPEIRYKKPEELAKLPALQLAILQNTARYVRPGGMLIYSTCTVTAAENEDVVQAFLDTGADYTLEGFTLPGDIHAPAGKLTLWPHVHGTDGFFIARLRRNGGPL